MRIYSKRHSESKERDFWVYNDDPQMMEKMMAIGISPKFFEIELLPWTSEDLDEMFNEMLEDIPE